MNSYLFILIGLVCGLAVYFDARKRNIKAAASWGILSFLFSVLGAIGYLWMIVRPNKRNI